MFQTFENNTNVPIKAASWVYNKIEFDYPSQFTPTFSDIESLWFHLSVGINFNHQVPALCADS